MRLAAHKGANGSKSAPNAEEQATNTMKIGPYQGAYATIEEAEKHANQMIHGGIIQEQNGQFHVWYVNA